MVDLNIELPDVFLDEEVRCGYTVTRQMKEVWAVELDLLKQILTVCKKYGLNIYADGGTLLGAIRHDGFIPWDDDIDLVMFRTEYDRLCHIAEKEFKYPYFFQTEETDTGSLRGHAQLRNSQTTGVLSYERHRRDINQGIFIDIFPLDSLPDNIILRYIQRKKIHIYSLLCRKIYERITEERGTSGLKAAIHEWIISFGQLRGDYRFWYNKFIKECSKYNADDTKYVTALCMVPSYNKKIIRRCYQEKLQHKFEMMEISVPAGYEKILVEQYGDWEKYEIGASYHGNVLFDTEIDYKTYLNMREE